MIFNREELYATFLDNEEMILSLLSRFIERTEGQMKTFPELIEAENYQSASPIAHMIKGAAFTMSGGELGRAAGCLELLLKKTGDEKPEKKEIEEAFSSLQNCFEQFKKEAEKFLNK